MIEDNTVFISIMAYLWPEQKMTQPKIIRHRLEGNIGTHLKLNVQGMGGIKLV